MRAGFGVIAYLLAAIIAVKTRFFFHNYAEDLSSDLSVEFLVRSLEELRSMEFSPLAELSLGAESLLPVLFADAVFVSVLPLSLLAVLTVLLFLSVT